MKTIRPTASCLFLLLASAGIAAAGDILALDDGGMEKMPDAKGIAIYEPEETKGKAKLKLDAVNPAEGDKSLRIEVPEGAYVSVSFPMTQEKAAATLRFSVRGKTAEAAEATIGIQSFTMESSGFREVEFKPLVLKDQFTKEWAAKELTVERNPNATHWQLSIALKGPATVWIDKLAAVAP
jgi:hypothetical protein